ncbi:MAG TPA: hypothetical protein VGE98_04080, partial [Thermoanaerobaculia bacterium]
MPAIREQAPLLLAIAPSAPDTIVATDEHAIERSDDGGETNVRLFGPHEGFLLALAFDPHDPQTLYAGTSGPVYTTRDGGTTWTTAAGPGPTFTFNLLVDPQHPDVLYATSDAGVWKSPDRGATWAHADSGLPLGLAASTRPIQLAIDPLTPTTLFVALNPRDEVTGGSVYKSTDGGATWAVAVTAESQIDTLAVDPKVPAHVYAGTQRTVLGSGDSGATWVTARAGLAHSPIGAVAADPHAPGRLYATTAVNFGGARSLFRSDDGGTSWLRLAPPLLPGGSLGVVVADPTTAGTVYVATDTLQKSTDAGATWRSLGLSDVFTLAIDPRHPTTLYAAGGSAFDPFSSPPYLFNASRSTDGGATWTSLTGALGTSGQHGYFSSIAIDPLHPRTVYLGGTQSFKTTDGGATWTALPLPQVLRILVDPRAPKTVYAKVFNSEAFGSLAKSTDGGVTWTRSDLGLRFGAGGLSLDATDSSLLYAGDGADLFVSTDAGASWGTLDDGLPHTRFGSAVVPDPRVHGTVYVGTVAHGLYAFSQAPSVCAPADDLLCLHGGRFSAKVSWRTSDDFTSQQGVGHALPLIADAGAFWFFDRANVDLGVRVVDDGGVNGKFWVVRGALTNVGYGLRVTDTTTGAFRMYVNPVGRIASGIDTNAVPA